MKKEILTTLLLTCLLLLNGCFFSDTPEDKDDSTYIVERLKDSCEIDSDKLANILTEDVSKEIECVGTKLDQFATYVRRSDPNYINHAELSRFINKFFPEDADALNDSLDLIFDLAHLILEDKEEVISLSNIRPLVLLFKTFNREAVYINNLLDFDDTICSISATNDCYNTFLIKRSKYRASVERLASYINNLLRGKKRNIDQIRILDFIRKLNKAFPDDNDEDFIDVDLAKDLLFVKRIFLGGNKSTLQTNEVYQFLNKLPYFATLLFDLQYGTTEVFESNPNEQVHLYANHLHQLKRIIYTDFLDNEIVFTTQELINALNRLLTGDNSPSDEFRDIDFNNFKSVIETLKGRILGGNALYYTQTDITNTLYLAQEVCEGIYFNSIIYDYYQERMSDPSPISEITLPTKDELPLLSYIRPDMIPKYWKIFKHIVKNYRYFTNSKDHIQHYEQDIIRSKYGLNEIYVMRWFSDRLLRAYGSPAGNGEYHGTQQQLEEALLSLRPLLEEFNFWPKKFETFAFNMLTLSDLFQPQSNGDIYLDLDEMTEYLELVVSTVNIHNMVEEDMLQYCRHLPMPNAEDDDPIFDPACYRKHFFQVFFDDLHLEDKFPRLYEYYQNSGIEELVQYHKFVEEFARDEMKNPDGSPVLMYNRDRVLTIGALLNIESAYVFFDRRRLDNQLTYGELEDAFLLFRNVIITLGELEGGKEKYARAVFYFMVDKLRAPSNTEVLRYYYFAKYEDIIAYRMNIAAILSYFKTLSEADIDDN